MDSSFSGLPSELQQLSLSAPSFDHFDIPERTEKPSWMTTSFLPPLSPSTTSSSTSSRRPPGASHTRSISDYSLVHPILAPLSTPTRNRHQTHRRTVSANTGSSNLDFFQSFSNTSLPHIDEHPYRARTNSPPEPTTNSYPNLQTHKHHIENAILRDGNTGKYYCSYCKKAFNRPSSLRIHIYSHTGEKPFVCEEEGCGRQFSVQSNMRRHLRIHRIGRAKSNK
ncbi:hypothetical protein BDB01DRAFT_722114 [Pilobolus umbonatus]|nr:hypothetical protein BDB01DRAFT_722114 [Pilobolus umbonatus]